MFSEDLICEVSVPEAELTMCARSEVTGFAFVFEPPRGQPDIVDGVGWGGRAVLVVGGEHQVPAEEEEFVGRLGEDVSGGGTVVEEDHFRGTGGEGTRPGGGRVLSGPA